MAAFERAIESLTRGQEKTTRVGEDLSAYWLRTCEGFRVDSNNGRVGIVEEVRLSSRKQPEALAVRTGIFRTQVKIVPVSDVESVIPRRKRVPFVRRRADGAATRAPVFDPTRPA